MICDASCVFFSSFREQGHVGYDSGLWGASSDDQDASLAFVSGAVSSFNRPIFMTFL